MQRVLLLLKQLLNTSSRCIILSILSKPFNVHSFSFSLLLYCNLYLWPYVFIPHFPPDLLSFHFYFFLFLSIIHHTVMDSRGQGCDAVNSIVTQILILLAIQQFFRATAPQDDSLQRHRDRGSKAHSNWTSHLKG